MALNDVVKHLRPLAELVASHGQYKKKLGYINILTEIERNGQLDSEEKLIIRVSEHCDHFNDFSASGCLLSA